MTCLTCGDSPIGDPKPSQPGCNDIPASLVTCFSGQSLPPELPTSGIPASAVSYTPPSGGCVPSAATVQEYLDKIASLYFSLFCPVAIAGTGGSCSILRIVNNKVVAATFSSVFNDCMECIAVAKLCPGNAGDVIQMVSGVPTWAPLPPATPPVIPPLTCAAVTGVLAGAGCIPAGTIAQNVGFNAAGGLVKAVPSAGVTPTPMTCTEFTPLLKTCPPDSTDPVPTQFLGYDAAGNPEKWNACAVVTAAINRSADTTLNGCVPDGVASPDRVLGYDNAAKEAKWYAPRERYLTEMRGGVARAQILSTVPQTLNNIIGHWAQSYERGLLGQPTWYNPTTGRITIARPAWYRVSFAGLMVRVRPNLVAAVTQGHIYAGITVVRASGAIDTTAYPGLAAVLRTGESPVIANGKDQDFIFSGEYFGPLAAGDQLWIRVICSNVPDNAFAIQALTVLEDGSSSWTVAEESIYTYHLV